MDLKETGWDDVELIPVFQHRVKWLILRTHGSEFLGFILEYLIVRCIRSVRWIGGLLIPHSWYNILYMNSCPS